MIRISDRLFQAARAGDILYGLATQSLMQMILVLLAAVTASQAPGQIFSPGARLEKLYEGGHLTEGVAAGPDGAIYFSDITSTEETAMQAGHILRFDPATKKTTVYRLPSGMSNGIKFDAQG